MPDPDSRFCPATGLKRPSTRARLMFALGRHHPAVSLAMMASSVLLAFAAGAIIASLSDKRLMLALIVFASLCGGVVAMLAVKPPWLARNAAPEHVTAALASATNHERPYLLASLESRLNRPRGQGPMTLFELTMVFASTRAEHGERARKRRARSTRALAAQEEALVQLVETSAGER